MSQTRNKEVFGETVDVRTEGESATHIDSTIYNIMNKQKPQAILNC